MVEVFVNDTVYEFLKNELKESGIDVDVDYDTFKRIINNAMPGSNHDILLGKEGLEYDASADYEEINNGRWLKNDGSIDHNDRVYIDWYNWGKELIDPLKEYYKSKLSVFVTEENI